MNMMTFPQLSNLGLFIRATVSESNCPVGRSPPKAWQNTIGNLCVLFKIGKVLNTRGSEPEILWCSSWAHLVTTVELTFHFLLACPCTRTSSSTSIWGVIIVTIETYFRNIILNTVCWTNSKFWIEGFFKTVDYVTQYEKQNNVLVTCVDPQRPQKIDTLSGLLFHSSKTIYGCFLRDLLPFPPLINLDLTIAAGRSSSLEDFAGSGTKIARRTVTTSNHLVSISFIVLSLFPLFSGWSIHTWGWCSLITVKTYGDSTHRAIF